MGPDFLELTTCIYADCAYIRHAYKWYKYVLSWNVNTLTSADVDISTYVTLNLCIVSAILFLWCLISLHDKSLNCLLTTLSL